MINRMNKKLLYREILDYIMIAAGMLFYAIGWTIFLLPNHIGNGGVAGFASIIYWGNGIPVSWTYFCLKILIYMKRGSHRLRKTLRTLSAH